jgi:hypothetical protein
MPLAKKGERFGGRKKGTPNKINVLLKDALIEAATLAGGKEGLIGYLKKQANYEPAAFMSLLGKVLPMQIRGNVTGEINHIHSTMTPKEAIEAYSQMINASATQLIEARPVTTPVKKIR